MKTNLNKKFWLTLVIFSLVGQIAWVVENMYFNVFIYKMFHATAADISIMVAASAVVATLTTWLVGAFSDKIRKRKVFICGGYSIWGITILAFALIRMDILTPIAGSTITAASLGVTLVILMDCVMTFFGSSANDASFNAWMTDMGNESNRGRIEGINAMMPLVATLVVFGGFSAFNLDQAKSWTMIYLIIGIMVLVIGILGCYFIEEPQIQSKDTSSFWKNIIYCFRPSVMKQNPLLYVVIGAFAVFGISIQIFMPYLILYYEKTLHMQNYVLIMAPAIILAAVITALYGKNYDQYGFKLASVPTIIMLMIGYIFLYLSKGYIPVFLGSLFMMSGYLTGMAVFGAMIRDHIPRDKAGMFQGLRIVGQVLIPGIIGPAIGAAVLKNAEMIANSDGTSSFLPNHHIFSAAFIAAAVLLIILFLIFRMMNRGHYNLNKDNMETRWTQYPRPQMKRDSFFSLNGEWLLNGESVRIPFAPESFLAGYHGKLSNCLTYQKDFRLPEGFVKKQVLLHFGAVDQIAEVWVNGKLAGRHEGGYLPFTFDITNLLVKNDEQNHLLVKVTDKLSLKYPYGKQRKKRGGMWYTPVSGIWQSVWLESVPANYITNIRITPDLNGISLQIENSKGTVGDYNIEVWKDQFHYSYTFEQSKCVRITIPSPQLWTPETPNLYQMRITSLEEHDVVTSYFALRTITIEQRDGISRVCLNHKPIFLNGVLDQGYFSDGIYLPASEQAYEKDILAMKNMGFNTLRKHIKIEPECFYYYCDKYGMLVLQDMVNNGHYSFIKDTAFPTFGKQRRNDAKKRISKQEKERRSIFIEHMKETMSQLYNHPCIIVYTLFNEGWGQFESDQMYDIAKQCDPSRLIDSTSGWFAQEKSDFNSLHIYFDAHRLPQSERPTIVTECGGYSYKVEDHIYSKYTHYGYGNCKDQEQLTDQIIEMYQRMIIPSLTNGLSGCIYTQLSDVEDETNGLLTYDRKICKVDALKLRKMFEENIESYFLKLS